MSDWVKSQEKNFSSPEALVDDEALGNPIQRERIDRAVEFIGGPGLKVLDVGCSGGGISQLIHDRGNECWGMDLPGVMARVPEERKKWFHVFSGDASRKPWGIAFDERTNTITYQTYATQQGNEIVNAGIGIQSGFYDVVWAGEIIEHMIDIEPFLTEAHRVLKPGGRIVLTTPNAVREINRIGMLIGEVVTWHEWNHIPHHVRYFTPSTLAQALAKYGFKPTRVTSGRSQAEAGGSVEDLPFFSPLEKQVLRKIIDRTSPQPGWKASFIIMEAKKP